MHEPVQVPVVTPNCCSFYWTLTDIHEQLDKWIMTQLQSRFVQKLQPRVRQGCHLFAIYSGYTSLLMNPNP